MTYSAGRILNGAIARCAALGLLLVGLGACVTEWKTATPEYHEKAVYLARFGQFIEWPAWPTTNAPVVIGVLGGNPFGDDLQKIVKDKNIDGRPIVIRKMTPLSDLKQCQILFIDKHQTSTMPLILNSLDHAPVLTVSGADGFLERGGMIHFFMEQGKVRFEINRAAVDRAGLKMNSQLAAMARHSPAGP